jgi:hypothetical protein
MVHTYQQQSALCRTSEPHTSSFLQQQRGATTTLPAARPAEVVAALSSFVVAAYQTVTTGTGLANTLHNLALHQSPDQVRSLRLVHWTRIHLTIIPLVGRMVDVCHAVLGAMCNDARS